ncbi:hypothetical protein IWQ61_003312 [Dispira simplex]|nr:hypothetical protein IWQ61_003312 [Dispira simplex]
MSRKQLCKFYARGHCKYGNNCRFSHEGLQNNQSQIQSGSHNNNRNQNNPWLINRQYNQNDQGNNNNRQRNQNVRTNNQYRDSNFRPSGGFPAGQGKNSVETDMIQARSLVWRFSSYGPGTGCANVILGCDQSEEEMRCKLYELRLSRPNDWQVCFSTFVESMEQQMEAQFDRVRNNSEKFVPGAPNQPPSAFGAQAQPFTSLQPAVGGLSQLPPPQPVVPLEFPTQSNVVPPGFPAQPNFAPSAVPAQQTFSAQNPRLQTTSNPPPSMADSIFYCLDRDHEYTANEREAFLANSFTLGGIPEYPPPPDVSQ